MKHKSLEMKYLVSCAALNLLFLANFVSSQIVDTTNYEYNITDSSSGQRVQFFNIRSPLYLSCNVTDEKARIEWRKDGKPISEDSKLKSRSSFTPRGKLTVKEAVADDAGNYSCVIVDGDTTKESVSITVSAKPAVKIPDNINIVEGEKLVVLCKVLGSPIPTVYWRNDNGPLNNSDERIKYAVDPETNINNTILIIEDVVLSDRDNYTCTARSPFSDNVYAEDSCNIRVKDKLAALWPFLGICVEVFVLCAIILVYEKKRNKAELEESDTDQSPDQKNTPDHGKDSDVRHRK